MYFSVPNFRHLLTTLIFKQNKTSYFCFCQRKIHLPLTLHSSTLSDFFLGLLSCFSGRSASMNTWFSIHRILPHLFSVEPQTSLSYALQGSHQCFLPHPCQPRIPLHSTGILRACSAAFEAPRRKGKLLALAL